MIEFQSDTGHLSDVSRHCPKAFFGQTRTHPYRGVRCPKAHLEAGILGLGLMMDVGAERPNLNKPFV